VESSGGNQDLNHGNYQEAGGGKLKHYQQKLKFKSCIEMKTKQIKTINLTHIY